MCNYHCFIENDTLHWGKFTTINNLQIQQLSKASYKKVDCANEKHDISFIITIYVLTLKCFRLLT